MVWVKWGVPASVVVGEGVVEDPGADLQEQMGTEEVPAHLLLLTMRLLITWLTVHSTNEVEMASLVRWRPRSWGCARGYSRTALSSLVWETLGPSMSRSTARSSMICRAR